MAQPLTTKKIVSKLIANGTTGSIQSKITMNTFYTFELFSNRRFKITESIFGMECTQTIRQDNKDGKGYGWATWVRLHRIVKKDETLAKWIVYYLNEKHRY